MAFGTFLSENAVPIADMMYPLLKVRRLQILCLQLLQSLTIRRMQLSLVQYPQDTLLWLNNWPAGLKLNTELSQFYCHSLLGIVVAWSSRCHIRYCAGWSLTSVCRSSGNVSFTSFTQAALRRGCIRDLRGDDVDFHARRSTQLFHLPLFCLLPCICTDI